MSAAIAFFLLADAATSCAPARGTEMPGGARIVRPVGTPGPVPFEPLGPTTGLAEPDAERQPSAADDAGNPGDERALQVCRVVPVQIV